MQPLLETGCTLDGSARTEVASWTGSVPLLVCSLLRRLCDTCDETSRLSKADIDKAAEAVLHEQRDILAARWDDCDVQLRADLAAVANGDAAPADLPDHRLRAIEERGFGSSSRRRVRSSCRLMERYAKAQAPTIAELKRLFGSSSDFETNIRSLLELRLAQVVTARTDRDLRDFVSRAVSDIDTNPELAINSIRGIADRALRLIWAAELPHDRTLPAHWITEWKHAGVKSPPEDRGKLPGVPRLQCSVLRLIVGTERVRRLSRYVTRPTCLLVDHLQSVGNFGQHRDESRVTVGFAASTVLAAISLVESLTADLSPESPPEGT